MKNRVEDAYAVMYETNPITICSLHDNIDVDINNNFDGGFSLIVEIRKIKKNRFSSSQANWWSASEGPI